MADFARLDRLLVELFLEAHPQPPHELVLDLDATEMPLHGHQEQRFWHGYYREYCYLPLVVFCGRMPLLVRLRSDSGFANPRGKMAPCLPHQLPAHAGVAT